MDKIVPSLLFNMQKTEDPDGYVCLEEDCVSSSLLEISLDLR